jgi:Raf kinase inhibitor-like YbhB/YbcL family protein
MIRRLILPALAAALLVSGAAQAQAITVSSPAFTNGGAIPSKYTCDGEGASPPIAWTGLPVGTKTVAVLVDDPDAPHGTFVHWIVFDVPATTTTLAEGATAGNEQGRNTKGQMGWTPPCPPTGMHHYHFRVFALDAPLTLSQPTETDLARAMRGHLLAHGELVGTYQRGKK